MLTTIERYQEIISKLKQGHRAIFKPLDEEMDQYLSDLTQAVSDKDFQALERIFCVLSNTQNKDLSFEAPLIALLGDFKEFESDFIIMSLSVVRKHVIEARQINGLRQDAELLKILEQLIYHDNPEVVEWCLRLIEEIGSQAVYFKRHLPKIMPGLLTFNKHKKNIKELVFILDQRFKSFPG